MTLNLSFWVVAWIWMAAAFLTAFLAIIISARSLDDSSKNVSNERHL